MIPVRCLPAPCQKLEKDFEVLDLHHIPCADNGVAEDLTTKASTCAPIPDGVFER
jgi:hypothetical protein